MKRVFLGGTRGISKWRDEFIPMLKIDYFNPVDADPGVEAEEKEKCDFLLFVITPEMVGSIFALAEAVHYSSKRPDKTIFCWFKEYGGASFSDEEAGYVKDVAELIINNGAMFFMSLNQIARQLNEHFVEIPFDPDMVECLIKRDTPTVLNLNQHQYEFKKNAAGDSVCRVMRKDHRRYLVGLPDFRVYQEDKRPKQLFTEDELDFMREWRIRDAEDFLAYVNGRGRIDRFNNSGNPVRKIACDKWKQLMPHMACPIKPPDPEKEEKPEPVFTSRIKEWLGLSADNFETFVDEKPEAFLNCPEDEFARAVEKWERIVFGKAGRTWPIVRMTA